MERKIFRVLAKSILIFTLLLTLPVSLVSKAKQTPPQSIPIVFIDQTDWPYHDILYSVNPDGSNLKVLRDDKETGSYTLFCPDSYVCDLAWSPDYRYLRYSHLHYFYEQYPFTLIMDMEGKILNVYDESASHFKWSSNGKHLAYLKSSKTTGTKLYIANADGTQPMLFTDRPVDDFEWSPDAKRIAISSRGVVLVTDFEQIKLKQVANRDLPLTELNWLGDGKTITFLYRDVEYSVDLSTLRQLKLITRPNRFCHCVWSPDGKTHLNINLYGEKIRLVNADGSNIRDGLLPKDAYSLIIDPSWSTDSTRVLLGISGGDSGKAIFTLKLGDPLKFELISNGEINPKTGVHTLVGGGVWSPDSSKVAYVDDGIICVSNPDGTENQCLRQLPQMFIRRMIWRSNDARS